MTEMPNTVEPAPKERERRSAKFWVLIIVVPLAIIVAGVLVYTASRAAFVATTETGDSSFSTGSVELTNDHVGTSVFTAQNLAPGATDTEDVIVTYAGSLTADVRLYSSIEGGSVQTLAPFLNLEITSDGVTWTGTLADFEAKTDFATGVLPTTMAENDTQTYTVKYTVASNAPQSSEASVTFVWEAQNQ
jgi:hypothetical protein